MIYKIIKRYLLKHKKESTKTIIYSLIVAVLAVIIPLIYSRITDDILNKDILLTALIKPIAALLILTLSAVFLNRYTLISKYNIGARCRMDLLSDAYNHLLDLPLDYFKIYDKGEIAKKVDRSGDAIFMIVSEIVFTSIPELFSIIGMIFVLGLIDIRLAAVVFAVGIAYSCLPLLRTKRIIEKEKQISIKSEKASGFIHDVLINIKLVKLYTDETRNKDKSNLLLRDTLNETESMNTKWANIISVQQLTIQAGFILILLSALFLLRNGGITPGELVLVLSYTAMIQNPFVRLSHNYMQTKRNLVSIKRVFDLIDEPIEPYNDGIELTDTNGNIKFVNVHYSYENNVIETLKGISLNICGNNSIGIIGPSGSGKTTFLNLLLRNNLKPITGKIFLDGIDTTTIKLPSLRKFIAVVDQEASILNRSVIENILLGDPNASYDDVVSVSKMANAYDFIIKLKNGFNEIVGENGTRLSGGEKLRISIARALLKIRSGAKILVLDEATASLDSISEKEFQNTLELLKNRNITIIIITHRLKTVQNCELAVFNYGEIVESGDHAKLYSKDGLYKKLYLNQVIHPI
ncbi:MAG: ABC transporter ATP-binding protein [Candidatus Paceibacterota bacterium]|jgi:ATP-binding cassette subfamily B protein